MMYCVFFNLVHLTVQDTLFKDKICCTVTYPDLVFVLHCYLSRLTTHVALLPMLIGSPCCSVAYPSYQNIALLPILDAVER